MRLLRACRIAKDFDQACEIDAGFAHHRGLIFRLLGPHFQSYPERLIWRNAVDPNGQILQAPGLRGGAQTRGVCSLPERS